MKHHLNIHAMRDGTASRDRAILDLLQLEELNLVPGSVTVKQLRELWSTSQPQVSRRVNAIGELAIYEVRPGHGRYMFIQPRPRAQQQPSAAERWEALRRQLQEVIA